MRRLDIISADSAGIGLVEPELLENREILSQIDVGLLGRFQRVQNFELKSRGSQFIPIVLKVSIRMKPGFQLESVAIENRREIGVGAYE